ncbi:MAG TPA: amino acid ABC transporter permease, partial [Nordella sp.]|nr:amino acid ABC transporter permease [Nordella sp.]
IAIPPTTATCLGLIKDTSLGVAIGYPELVSVGGTILDVSGHALEVIAITIAFYMSLTLLFSTFMSWYHARIELVRR